MTQDSEDEWPFSSEGKRPDLFFTEEDRPVFVQIMKEMNYLKEYCELCLNETLFRWGSSGDDLERFEGEHSETPDLQRRKLLEIWISETQYERDIWENNLYFVAPAMCLVLLAIFLEKSLKSIAIDFAPKQKSVPRQSRSRSMVDEYLGFLRTDCGFDFVQPATTVGLIAHCRSVRNKFAHGDWDGLESEIAEINLREAFSAVTTLLENIDAGQPRQDLSKHW